MCDPFTLAAIAIPTLTSVGSSFMQNKAAEQTSQAQLNAQRAFQDDVQQSRNAANEQFQNSIQQSSLPEIQAQQNESAQQREQASLPQFNQESLLPSQGGTSDAVKTAIVQDQNRAVQENKSRAKRQAILESFGDADLMRDIALKQNANRIGTQGEFVGGALDNLDTSLNAAKYAGEGMNNRATMLNAIGSVAGLGAGAYGDYLGSIPKATGRTVPSTSVAGARYLID